MTFFAGLTTLSGAGFSGPPRAHAGQGAEEASYQDNIQIDLIQCATPVGIVLKERFVVTGRTTAADDALQKACGQRQIRLNLEQKVQGKTLVTTWTATRCKKHKEKGHEGFATIVFGEDSKTAEEDTRVLHGGSGQISITVGTSKGLAIDAEAFDP